MLTRITDRKIPCVYIHVYRIKRNWGTGPYNCLCHADNRRYFSGLSLTRSRREAHVLLGEERGEIWTCSCWLMNSNMLKPKKIGRPLSLSLYNLFNGSVLQQKESIHLYLCSFSPICIFTYVTQWYKLLWSNTMYIWDW